MEMSPELKAKRQAIIDLMGKELIESTQKDIDAMKKMPQYAQYIAQRKMELLSGPSGKLLDQLLTLEIIK